MSAPPTYMRFHVGLMMISLMHTCGGCAATQRMVSPRSAGCSIFLRSSGEGGIGRRSMIGVATSAGQIAQARMLFTHSSMLIVSVSEITAALVPLYAAPTSEEVYTPAHDEMLITTPSLRARIAGRIACVQ